MTRLNSIEVPSHYNGVGLHDTPGSETAAWDYNQSANHARELRAHGVTLYKLFGSGTKGSRAAAYADNGIVVLHRWWPGGAHWGKPPAEWLMPRADYDYLLSCKVSLFEPGWNEFNLADEWVTSIPYTAGIARAVLDAWEEAGSRYGGFGHLLFPSNTPGGHVDHRACYREIVAEISNRGLAGTIKHVAIHPRPLNNPPSTTWTATNTCTFDEWRWIRDQFSSVGVNAYYWATEHGYSVGDCQNTNYPTIDLARWTDYNWDLFVRLNPAHQSATEGELAGVTYWFNAGWGHWGPWPKDALVDSTAPEMPAPSPLWSKMGNLAGALAFSRYEGTPPPPPPPDRARGLDVCRYQGDINWDLVKADGYSFAMIRVSGPNNDRTGVEVDPAFEANYAGAGEVKLLRGGYHGLVPEFGGQALMVVSAVGGRPLELGYWSDLENRTLTDNKITAHLEAVDQRIAEALELEPGKHTGVYTNPAFMAGRDGSWGEGRKLWVAHWQHDLELDPLVPAPWTEWEFWQWTNEGTEVPGVPNRTCLDAYKGTQKQLYDAYENPNGGNGGNDVIEIVDRNGNVIDNMTWETVQRDYGLSLTEADPPEGATVFRLARLVYDSSAETNWRLYVLDEDGTPLQGVVGFLGIYPDSGEVLPADAAPRISEEFQGQPEGRPNRALVLQPNDLNFTNMDGYIQHSLGPGSNYVPPGPASHWAWIMAGDHGYYSDVPAGFGMWENHLMFWPVFQKVVEGDDPGPGPTPTPGSWRITGDISLSETIKLAVDLVLEPVE